MSSIYSPLSKDVVSHLCDRRFSQRIICPSTSSPVTFADCGEESSQDIVLFCLPSGCSRWVGVGLDGICRKEKVRLIAIDRPGSGGTRLCPISTRIQTSTLQTVSVLSHLQIAIPISILTHSAGVYYAFNLLLEHPHLFHPSPRIVSLSPWVSASVSGSSLYLLPSFVINSAMRFGSSYGPDLARLAEKLGGMSVGVASSIGFTSNQSLPPELKEAKNLKIKFQSQKKYPKATFHPPYTPRSTANSFALDSFEEVSYHPSTGKKIDHQKLGAEKLLGEFVMKEGVKGISEDFLLSLGRAGGERGGDRGMESLLKETLSTWEKQQGKLRMTVVWALEDGIIPSKGRTWLSQLLTSSRAVEPKILEMAPPGAGHDDPLLSNEVLTCAMVFLKGLKEEQAVLEEA